MRKWLKFDIDGNILLASETYVDGLTEVEMTQSHYNDFVLGKLIYLNGEFLNNPNYMEPTPTFEEQVEDLRLKKQFGQTTILEFMVDTQVEGLLMQNPQLAQASIQLTQGLVDSLEKGWLTMSLSIIKNIPSNNLNSLVTADLLLTYRNKINNFLNLPTVNSYDEQ